MLASAAYVCLMLIYGGLCLPSLRIVASKGTLYPLVTFPRNGMMFMERCTNRGRYVEFDEIAHSSIHVCCLIVYTVFIYCIVLL